MGKSETRVQQLKAVSELGLQALARPDFSVLADHAVELITDALQVQIATVDELGRHSTGRKARREDAVEEVVAIESALPRSDAVDSAAVADVLKRVTASLATPESSAGVNAEPWARFPRGKLHFGVTENAAREIGLRHGGGWDVDLIADAYREHMGDRLNTLSGSKLEKSWKGFCEAFLTRRGRPS